MAGTDVGHAAARLVGVDLEKMERLGYATASKFPLLAGTVIDNYGYFSGTARHSNQGAACAVRL